MEAIMEDYINMDRAIRLVASLDIKILMQDSLISYGKGFINTNIEDTHHSHQLFHLLKAIKDIAIRYLDSTNEDYKEQLIYMFRTYNKNIVDICGLIY